jgi:hypothetical protein
VATERLVELDDGSTIDVGDGQWEQQASAPYRVGDVEHGGMRLVLMRHLGDRRALIYVTRASTQQRFGEVVTAETDPLRAMLRCAKRAGAEPIDRKWYDLVQGFS